MKKEGVISSWSFEDRTPEEKERSDFLSKQSFHGFHETKLKKGKEFRSPEFIKESIAFLKKRRAAGDSLEALFSLSLQAERTRPYLLQYLFDEGFSFDSLPQEKKENIWKNILTISWPEQTPDDWITARMLLQHGASPNWPSGIEWSENEHLRIFGELLEEGKISELDVFFEESKKRGLRYRSRDVELPQTAMEAVNHLCEWGWFPDFFAIERFFEYAAVNDLSALENIKPARMIEGKTISDVFWVKGQSVVEGSILCFQCGEEILGVAENGRFFIDNRLSKFKKVKKDEASLASLRNSIIGKKILYIEDGESFAFPLRIGDPLGVNREFYLSFEEESRTVKIDCWKRLYLPLPGHLTFSFREMESKGFNWSNPYNSLVLPFKAVGEKKGIGWPAHAPRALYRLCALAFSMLFIAKHLCYYCYLHNMAHDILSGCVNEGFSALSLPPPSKSDALLHSLREFRHEYLHELHSFDKSNDNTYCDVVGGGSMRNYVKELAKAFRENELLLDSSEDAALKQEWEDFRSIFLKEAHEISSLIGTEIPFRADVLMLHGDFWDKLSWEAQSFLLSDEHWSREDRKERLNIIREFAQKFPEKRQGVQDFEKALLDLEKSDVVKMMD